MAKGTYFLLYDDYVMKYKYYLHHQNETSHLTHCSLGDFNEILDKYFSSQIQWLMAEIPAVKLPSEECH